MPLSLPAHAVDGFNLPGSDYDNFSAGSPMLCMQTCAGDWRCRAWTWVKPGIQEPGGHCWLKHRVPNLVKDSCCNSGAAENIQRDRLRAEIRIARAPITATSLQPILKLVRIPVPESDNVRRVDMGETGRAGTERPLLAKNRCPHPVADNNCISGVKFVPRRILD
jgi:hypothetical protein